MSPLSVTQRDDTYVCADCGWRTGPDETHLGTDSTEQAIQHHVETGHGIVDRSVTHQTNYSRFRLSEGRV